jgi:hypothetical protein
VTTSAPRTPQEFIEQASNLVRAGKDREVLALADRHGEAFLGQFTAEELNRLEGMFEGAQMIVDLEEWGAGPAEAGHRGRRGYVPSAASVRIAASR